MPGRKYEEGPSHAEEVDEAVIDPRRHAESRRQLERPGKLDT